MRFVPGKLNDIYQELTKTKKKCQFADIQSRGAFDKFVIGPDLSDHYNSNNNENKEETLRSCISQRKELVEFEHQCIESNN